MNAIVWDEQNRLFVDNELRAQVHVVDGLFKVQDRGLPSPEWLSSAYRTLEAAKEAAEEAAFD